MHPFDRVYGTETSGLLPAEWLAAGTTLRVADLTAYYGIAPSILRSLIDLWRNELAPEAPLEHSVFLDIGSGKGRALLIAAEYPFLRVEGVELNPTLSAVASANLARRLAHGSTEPLAPMQVHTADATRHPLPLQPTLAFLFHPFERLVLRRFLRHVTRSIAAAPRPFDLLYANAEHGDLLDRDPALRKLWAGRVVMSAEDHAADLAEIATQQEYGSTGDEICAVYRVQTGTED